MNVKLVKIVHSIKISRKVGQKTVHQMSEKEDQKLAC